MAAPYSTDSYRHRSAKRRNAPTPETEPIMTAAERAPKPFSAPRREQALPVLRWDRQGETSTLTGDPEADAEHSFGALPLYVREKIDPKLFVAQLHKRGSGVQISAEDFNGLPPGADPLNFYEHAGNWQNRLIHGDSAEVMKSLIAKDGLAQRVQTIYYDPPYGMSYQSNFQPSTDSLNVKDSPESVPVGDALPIKAFRDTYRNGIHSYLDGIHKQCVLARELLTESGSLFLQIGDENVHRLAVLLDEVFGADNRLATITWRSTGGSSSKTLPESASYLLWYAKNKFTVKYNHLYEKRDRQEIMDSFGWAAAVELLDSSSRAPKPEERRNVSRLPQDARLFKRMNPTSMGHSETGRSVDFFYEGTWRAIGAARHWRVSVCTPRRTNGTRIESETCSEDPMCGMHSLAAQNRLSATPGDPRGVSWKQYEDEVPGKRLDNVWGQQSQARKKRYVVQTADSIIERCLLMTTEPGDLVLDPTCGSGATADVAETWGRRWITSDVQRVSVAVARSHLLSRAYPWHNTVDGSADPAAGFKVQTMPRVSAATLAYGTLDDPENQIRLTDRTDVNKRKARICSAFTVESISPYNYLPVTEQNWDSLGLPTAEAADAETILGVLKHTPVCDSRGRPLFDVVETTPWPDTRLARHGARCASAGRDEEFTAAVMIAAADATVTHETARRAAIEALDNDPACKHLILVGYEFEAGMPAAVQQVHIHRVVASKDLQLPETIKRSADGGSFTLLAEPDCHLRPDDDGRLTVELLGCDIYDPATGRPHASNLHDVDCWMIDTNHDALSFRVSLIYFPNGVAAPDRANFKKLMKSLRKDLDPDAEAHIASTVSQPFAPPDPGRNIAVKVITNTGAEMTTTIDSGW